MAYTSNVIAIVLFVFSALALVVPNLANACLFILFILGLALLLMRSTRDKIGFSDIWRSYWPLAVAMVSLLLAVGIHQCGTGIFEVRDYDRPFRLAIFGFIFFAVLCVPLRQLVLVQWGWIICTLLACIKAAVVTDGGRLPNTGSVGFLAGIAFSNMVLLVGVWALLSLYWSSKPWSIASKIVAGILALYVTYMVKTRGTWLALPFFAVFFVWYFKAIKRRYKLAIVLFPILLLVGAFFQNDMVKKRLYDVKSDLVAYQDGSNKDTSVGQRLELWRGSFLMFEDEPIFGVGRDNFRKKLEHYVERQQITHTIVAMPHSHNGLFFHAALWGTAGLIAWIITYLVPLFYFGKHLLHIDPQVRVPAAMGVILCGGFLVFDMTDVMFFWVTLNGIYVINLALFMACIVRIKRGESMSPSTR